MFISKDDNVSGNSNKYKMFENDRREVEQNTN